MYFCNNDWHPLSSTEDNNIVTEIRNSLNKNLIFVELRFIILKIQPQVTQLINIK